MKSLKQYQVLFWIGIIGIVFYVLSPILFPKIPGLRQPELLPVYTLMLGLGQLLKGSTLKERAAELLAQKIEEMQINDEESKTDDS